ncbi:hemerythrin domain-containing protein [Aeromicrobium wangtongii]|uniref:Hemerythrin domain-containing protein n=1 Tax=Aeromicrobium wangtongii TaxID=2969247 RepID=A0ABY5M2M4_9ACTN|nr:hemerythrin domain-containing protein [Aeromicrobium wangtongii]MCD9198429.1 hemerythrin domain-containing protein [Aeromicrobium wangtongii]UUP12458.1 hemerythrin domain-containing protein [Aeromicrobium wangtongii]
MTDEARQLGCQTDDMLMIHTVFRREFRLAGPMVRHVDAGDTAQAARVATYLAEIVTALHHHHHHEDEIIWDTLVDRSPGCALHVGQMKAQHAEVSDLLDRVDGLIPVWVPTADAESRDRLASAVEAVSTALDAHLGQEEEVILPVAASSFTQAEWDRLGEAGMASVPRNRLLVQLGYLMEDATPEQRAMVMAHVPLAARLLYRAVGRRQYEKEIRTLRAPV